ncbi:hypothetical protein HNQ51_001720 [Inhella inkyongensis]|uniref:DUF2190 domain-containing protein n=1 Tax=Inhella inkyongensis TaxID=392593 RepID=A0A840S5X0_9BURK|nr:DUF2190 family protein [Inhella inkyongensis]MBB5204406.1 hypothetical protein [Inhella inkyongensis]
MKTEKILLTTTVLAVAALPKLRFVTFAGGVPAAGARTLGVAAVNADNGEQTPVNTHGELLVEAGAAIAVGAEVETDASGRAITKTTGVVCGVARDAATAAGEFIRILR